MDRCPFCRARLKTGFACGRCGADLGTLYRIRTQAQEHALKSVQNLLAGNRQGAVTSARAALFLDATEFNQALMGFILSAIGERNQ